MAPPEGPPHARRHAHLERYRALLLVSLASTARAQEFIDQANGDWTRGGTVMTGPAQEVMPAWPNLVRIEIMVYAINPTSAQADVTLALYRDGALVASRTTRPTGATHDTMVWPGSTSASP